MPKFQDLIGQRFGKLLVITRAENDGRRTQWECLCDCGNTTIVKAEGLKSGDTKSCGCLIIENGKSKLKDLTGQVFGKLTVISRAENNNQNRPKWNCLCECGNMTVVSGSALKNGDTQSCGCFKLSETIKRSTKHKNCKTKLYKKWSSAKTRCYNPKSTQYFDYGGRGIQMCEAWLHNFQDFYDWAMKSGYIGGSNLTLDRIDVNGNYCPENCRFVPMTIQARNQRLKKTNKSGVMGVFYNKKINKYEASINIYLGSFNTLEVAAEARKQAEIKYWGENR